MLPIWLVLACGTGLPDGSHKEGGTSSDDTSADTGGDSGDPGPVNDYCGAPGRALPLDMGGSYLNPYGSTVAADLDGGGVGDVLHEAQAPRGVKLVRGEDVVFGVSEATTWFPATLSAEGFGLRVGVTGDLDGDGLDDVLVGETSAVHEPARLVAWSASRPDMPLAIITLEEEWHGHPSETPGPDVDGDGRGEILATLDLGDEASHVALFSGTTTGDSVVDDAHLLVEAELGVGYDPVPAGDLDGDGIGDVLYLGKEADSSYAFRFLPGDVAASGGILDDADIDLLVTFEEFTRRPLFLDLDGDERLELYALDWRWSRTMSVLGFAGESVATAALTGTPLTADNAFVRIDSTDEEYLGGQIVPVTDLDCEVGIAASAHMGERVYLFSHADLVAGGVRDASASPQLTGSGHWFGYSFAGGQDLDLDGSLDLVVGSSDAETFGIYLSPAKLAIAP